MTSMCPSNSFPPTYHRLPTTKLVAVLSFLISHEAMRGAQCTRLRLLQSRFISLTLDSSVHIELWPIFPMQRAQRAENWPLQFACIMHWSFKKPATMPARVVNKLGKESFALKATAADVDFVGALIVESRVGRWPGQDQELVLCGRTTNR